MEVSASDTMVSSYKFGDEMGIGVSGFIGESGHVGYDSGLGD